MICATPGVSVVPLMLWMVGVVPSGSLSPVNGVKVIAVPSSVMLYVSVTAIGASLVPVTVIVNTEVLVPPLPSDTR